METHCYLIAIGDIAPTREFNHLLEKFAPRFSLQGVHVVLHSKRLSIDELSGFVRATLPKGSSFFVAIADEHHFQPSEEDPEEIESSDPS